MELDDFYLHVGKLICYFQCIESDIKSIYAGMLSGDYDKNLAKVSEWSLGQAVNALESLDHSDNNYFLEVEDYKLLKEITDMRNFYAHNCYTKFAYVERDIEHYMALDKAGKRIINDFNRINKFQRVVEKVRINYFKESA
ncbi:MAG: hypothetical protein FWE36_08455 [Erysipelotrichales bacterium]|nr:hypothetical protein [Erysipelotrichales bacterium]